MQDDVMNNTFNILRMFAAIYGPSEAPKMLVSNNLSVFDLMALFYFDNTSAVFLMFLIQ